MDNFLCKFDQFVEYDQPLPTIPILSAPFCYCSTGLSRVLNLLIDDVRYESAHQAPTLKDQKKRGSVLWLSYLFIVSSPHSKLFLFIN